ncbi:hypothetical protein BgiMline_015367, partial [Biomphalaria glabrata]
MSLTNKELTDFQYIVNNFSEIEDKGEEIENVSLTYNELKDCQYFLNNMSEIEDKGE